MPQLLFRGKRSKQSSPSKPRSAPPSPPTTTSSPVPIPRSNSNFVSSASRKQSRFRRSSSSSTSPISPSSPLKSYLSFRMPPPASEVPTALQDLLKDPHHRHASGGSDSDVKGLGPLVEEDEIDNEIDDKIAEAEGTRSPATARAASPAPSPGSGEGIDAGRAASFPSFNMFGMFGSDQPNPHSMNNGNGNNTTTKSSASNSGPFTRNGSGTISGMGSRPYAYNPAASRETIASSDAGTEVSDSGVSHSLAALSEHAVIYEQGLMMRNHVLGEDYVQEKTSRDGGRFSLPMQTFATETAWGTIWTRPGLELKTRSLLCLAMLTALGRWGELATHVRGAIRNGCSEVEIQEALLQASAYCGLPSGFEAFRTAEKVLSEMKAENGTLP